MLSRRGTGPGIRGGRLHGRGPVCTVGLSVSMSRGMSTTVMEDDENQANVRQKGAASTETDHLKTVSPGLQSMLM